MNSGVCASSGAAANLVLSGGTLAFTGTAGNGTRDRPFTIGTNGSTLDASGSGALAFTNIGTLTLSGSKTARTFKLTGTGIGRLNGIIGDKGTG